MRNITAILEYSGSRKSDRVSAPSRPLDDRNGLYGHLFDVNRTANRPVVLRNCPVMYRE
jgi:hypothetical protein